MSKKQAGIYCELTPSSLPSSFFQKLRASASHRSEHLIGVLEVPKVNGILVLPVQRKAELARPAFGR
jgi:hypothetical protein